MKNFYNLVKSLLIPIGQAKILILRANERLLLCQNPIYLTKKIKKCYVNLFIIFIFIYLENNFLYTNSAFYIISQ
ncbi:hypothetical protein NIES2130_19795 [Scytonema sp. HK-05]|nr:hypothetical protein NIES2130_19795 [Scytonema sp. HK-05]